jgi:hypothetical protein
MIKILGKNKELEFVEQRTYYIRDKRANIDMCVTSDIKVARDAFKFCERNMKGLRLWRKLQNEKEKRK